ncbi:MAG TPA: T9SS type A sorting domain-containing protein [Ignavibacteriaceae bacterium]|nr:T9SS type A sorting domain-containing protein [Ignavibacteriaceae bacterium]
MKNKLFFTSLMVWLPILFFVMFTKISFAQKTYPLVTLHDINYIADSLLPSLPPTPLAGDTVRVRGVVTVRTVVGSNQPGVGDRRPVIWAGARWACYIQDKDNPEWGGIQILQNDTTSAAAQQTLIDLADTATVYEFTGIVTQYYTTTELVLITAPSPIPIEEIETLPKRPDPIQLTLDSLFSSPTKGNYFMRKYQGVYVEIKADENHDLITSDRVTGTSSTSGNFKINDGNGRYVMAYAQSTYFKMNSNGIRPTYQSPVNGTYLSYIRGVLTMRSNATVGVDYWIVPLYPEDLGPALVTPPSVSNVVRNVALVTSNLPVTVKCLAKGVQAGIKSVKLFYRVNQGALDSLDMTNTIADSIYSATIPGVALDSALVDYYVKATDLNGTSVLNPANINTNRYFYLVLNRQLTIQDVRYTPFVSAYSAYNNFRVSNIEGVVISDTSDIPGSINRGGTNPPRIYIQNVGGPWSGILLGTIGANSNAILNLHRGDRVSVSGTVMLGSLGTKIDSITNIQVLSSNNTLPAPQLLSTNEIGVNLQGALTAEKWNGTLVKYQNIVIDSLNADGTSNFGESYVNDGTLPHTRLIWSDGNTHYHNGWNTSFISKPNYIFVAKGDRFGEVVGVLGYTHAYYKLAPRKDDDITGYVSNVDANKDKNGIPDKFVVEQNYPNPFNPSTIIAYSIPQEGFVSVKIYNLLGQEVATLVNDVQSPGNYKVNFDASRLSSGVYFYSVKSDNFSIVKKMMLMK